jgi:hypothetical protein
MAELFKQPSMGTKDYEIHILEDKVKGEKKINTIMQNQIDCLREVNNLLEKQIVELKIKLSKYED